MRRLRGGWLAALLAVTSACSADRLPDRAVPDTFPATPELAVASRAIDPAGSATEVLTVLLTSDEGVDAAGLDAAVSALLGRPGLDLVVIAPASSGRSDTGAGGDSTLMPAATLGGYPARAVGGTPADAVIAALDVLSPPPDIVVVGIRSGQTFGRDVDRSGGIAAAQAAADRGVPALVVNAEVNPQVDLAAAALQLMDIFDRELDRLVDGRPALWNLNVPTCLRGTLRGRVDAAAAPAVATDGLVGSDCTAPATLPHRSDVEAFSQGFVSFARLD